MQIANHKSQIKNRQRGFTLLEVLVSLSILSILFLLLFVPLLSSMSLVHQGQGDIHMQDALRAVMTQITRELRSAIVVYSNDGGATTLAPTPLAGAQHPVNSTTLYVANGTVFNIGDQIRIGANNPDATNARLVEWVSRNRIGLRTGIGGTPTQVVHGPGEIVLGTGPYYDNQNPAQRVALLSRIDFELPQNLLSGGRPRIELPLRPEPQIVTYYVRLRDPNLPYDERDNPLVLFRAQHNRAQTQAASAAAGNANLWLYDNANLEPFVLPQTSPIGMHRALTPVDDLDVPGRLVTDPIVGPPARLVADTNFQCEDTDNDSKVDKVTINLVLGRYDAARRETVRATLRQTVELRNAR